MAARSRPGWGLLILRLVVGFIFLMHGLAKVRGGLAAGAAEVSQRFAGLEIPSPELAAWGVILLELVGGVALMLGVFTSLWNVLFIIHMTAGILYVHGANGFFVVGPGQNGMEYNLLLVAANLCLLLAGAGALAVTGRRARARVR